MRKFSDQESVTTCSSEKNNSIKTVIHNDYIRYERKGYGLFMAIVIFCLFFYLSPKILYQLWQQLVDYDHKLLHITINIVWSPTFYLIGNLMMYFIYTQKIPFFEKYRVNQKPWQWEEDNEKWKILFKKCIKVLLINFYCVQLPVILADVYVIGSKCRYDMESFPTYFEIISQILFMMFAEDFSFYWLHRLFHVPYLYQKFHKVHHQFNITVSIGALYTHPLEYLFSGILPTALGFLLLGNHVHYTTFMIWQVMRVFETIDGHCGYEFSWSPYRLVPFSGSSEYHNFHHSHNVGVFASFFTIWDTVFGTNKDYFQYKAKKEQEQLLNQLRVKHIKKVQ